MANSRGLRPASPSSAFKRGQVNVADAIGAIWNPLYDYQTLAAAGAASQRFFIVPNGQGGKTVVDTNMDLSGQLSVGQMFQVTGIQVELYPGVAIQGTAASAFADDVYNFYKGGALIFNIGQKAFVTQGNLLKFAPVNRLGVAASTGLTTDTILYCTATGREFTIADLTLQAGQNFNVELIGLSALPSGENARIGVTLNGFMYRNAQ